MTTALIILVLLFGCLCLFLAFLLFKSKVSDKTTEAEKNTELPKDKITDNEETTDDEDYDGPEENLPRASRGNDKWVITVYPAGERENGEPVVEPFQISVFDCIYLTKKNLNSVKIGRDKEKCHIFLEDFPLKYILVTFEQDLGMCYYKSNGIVGSLTDGLVLHEGDYEIVFTLEEKEYAGFLFKKSEPKPVHQPSEDEDISLEEIKKHVKKTVKKSLNRTRNSLIDWFKRNF